MIHWATGHAALLAENCSQGIVLLDRTGHILHANIRAATIFGAPGVSSLMGLRLHSEESTAGIRVDTPFFVSLKNGPQSGRYDVSTEFGTEFPAEITIAPTNDGTYLALISDASEQVDLERGAVQKEKLAAMDNIVAGIAHELNNSMTAVLGYSELLLTSENDPKRKQRLAMVTEEADRCAKIIANMLTFTRGYGRGLEMANINTLLNEVLTLQSYQMRIDHIKIHCLLDEAAVESLVQSAAIRRLFLNLVHNAHQALMLKSDPDRNMWAVSELNGNTLRVQIMDDGPGIPKSLRHKIFDPFFTTRSFGEGMGLGLSVAYGIVHDHNGTIWMEPRVGGGTVINIELPLVAKRE